MKKLLTYFVFIVLCHGFITTAHACISSGLQLTGVDQLQNNPNTDLMQSDDDDMEIYPMDIFSLHFN